MHETIFQTPMVLREDNERPELFIQLYVKKRKEGINLNSSWKVASMKAEGHKTLQVVYLSEVEW